MSKVFFCPFKNPQEEDLRQIRYWTKDHLGSDYHFYKANGDPLIGPFIKLGMFDEVYIIGEGAPGSEVISSEQTTKGSCEDASFVFVAKRLQAGGLPTTFGGAIKVWACNSGDVGPQGEHAFADCFARFMYHKLGYTNCKFIGYNGELSAYKRKEQGDWVKHNYSYVDAKDRSTKQGKASEFRIIFDGNKPIIDHPDNVSGDYWK